MSASTEQPEIIAQAIGVTRSYPGVIALDNVDFEVGRGEVRALLGQNGAGKSTLIRLLSGVDVPSSGTILIAGTDLGSEGVHGAADRGVATCYQELSLVADLTVAENFFLGKWPRGRFGIDTKAMATRAAEALASLGATIDPNAITGTLTLAQQQIVEIARALQDDPKLLILDEPTSALASAEVALVLETVRRVAAKGVAVIYVSHRMDEIRQIAASATVMRNGKVVKTLSLGESDTATIIRLMIGTDPENQRPQAVDHEPGPVVLEARELAIPPKVTDVSFQLRAGEILGLAGLLGSGRTELLRAIAGFERLGGGDILVDGETIAPVTPRRMRRAGIAMTPEDRKREGALMNLGIDENIVMSDYRSVSRSGVLSVSLMRDASEALARRLSIKAHDLAQPISTMSGGNQQKAVIARWLHADADILLLDEPTRGVDVEAKAQIYAIMRAVADEGKAVVFVSSELEELPLCCDRVLVLRDGSIQREFVAPHITLSDLLEASMASHSTQEAS
ncbi:sugar ABC transporter ATP-binding protein [Agromyces albus]|uniref:Sugar ABC transporter ATP-binding protein n=1 Tax=Agromyces albus TaxID=205332 RepID=A0A4Q2KT22_9MICO|nr:sugar ABC transporter ATP-binding protein [Agromyces albus]RXZ68634.1 sugar ABC transporter ATP-binding protein [Agromyces albus]